MSFSDDGGYTWSSEYTKSMGKIGERMTRVIFERLGTFRQRTFRFSVSDPVLLTAITCQAEVEIGEL